jgi:hypothetical protein
MRMLAGVSLALIVIAAEVQAAPNPDIHAYCAELHHSEQYRYVCEQGEQAARERLDRQRDGAVAREAWEPCVGTSSNWRTMELCMKKELRAKALPQHR